MSMIRHKVVGSFTPTYWFVSDQTGQAYLAKKINHGRIGGNVWHIYEARIDALGSVQKSSELRCASRLLADVPARIRRWEVTDYR